MNVDFSKAFNDVKHFEKKQTLLEAVINAEKIFLAQAELFYAEGRRDKSTYYQICNELVKAADVVIALAGSDYESSLFLRNIVKSFIQIKESSQELLCQLKHYEGSEEITEPLIPENSMLLYVSLYQHCGGDLRQWESQLCSIEHYMMGRPIYQSEADINQVIRLKTSQIQEAYVVVAVTSDKLVRSCFTARRKDRFGNELITVQVGGIKKEQIIEFVHVGRRYYFHQDRLIEKNK